MRIGATRFAVLAPIVDDTDVLSRHSRTEVHAVCRGRITQNHTRLNLRTPGKRSMIFASRKVEHIKSPQTRQRVNYR